MTEQKLADIHMNEKTCTDLHLNQTARPDIPGCPEPSARPEVSPAGSSSLAYEQALPAVQVLLQQTLTHVDVILADVCAHLDQSGGKNFRAALLLAAAADEAGQVPVAATRAAAALELLHLATLVHDDIIDEAPLRRGLPSVQSKFGKKTAVIGGDYLFCLSFNLIASISAGYPEKFSDFSRAMTNVCVGELNQFKHQADTDLSVYSHLRIIANKTAVLFTLALYAGGVLGGDSEREARRLGRLGFYIGMLFQLADDCLDYVSSARMMKKQVNHDLAEGVITLPLILHLVRHPELKPLLKSQLQAGTLSAADVALLAQDVVAQGDVDRAWAVAERCYQKATRLLAGVSGSRRRQYLGDLLASIRIRQY